jgi:glutaredoxin-like YruB-family protein
MLNRDSQGKTMKPVKLYSRQYCGWCLDAKEYLKEHGIPFEEVDVGRDPVANEEMRKLSGQRYVPTIVIDGNVLTNFDVEQLKEFLAKLNAPTT